MYQTAGSIKMLLDKVKNHDYILPAIQREFVWRPDQICQLFDSLLQGYPFGTFLFWKIKNENLSQYQFFDFMCNYHQRDRIHCEKLIITNDQDRIAVLDGQQRMTALNIGLRGSYTWKTQGKWWKSPDAFVKRRLYLNLLKSPQLEDDTHYEFDFLSEEESKYSDEYHQWFLVPRVLEIDPYDIHGEISKMDLPKGRDVEAGKMVSHLHNIIHNKQLVTYYLEEGQELSKVLNIFIRMNSGGTPLSYSDLLLSIAVAQWQKLDAREEIHNLVDEMNRVGDGFNFSKDLVLKAGLMLSELKVAFKVENFNKSNMALLEQNWTEISSSLRLGVNLLSSFGFCSSTLKADSVLLPVAYYLHCRNLDANYLSHSKYASDRLLIRTWLIKTLLKSGIWGSGLDSLLTSFRSIIKNCNEERFPAPEITVFMAENGKSLRFEEEEMQSLLDMDYGNPRIFPLLSLLFPGHDFSHHFHVDHIFPKSRFTKSQLKKAGIDDDKKLEEWIDMANRVPNLQLLEGGQNNDKRQKMPHDWYRVMWPEPLAYVNHLQTLAIDSLPENINEFDDFYLRRRETLMSRLHLLLS